MATNFGGPSPFAAELLFSMLGDGSYRKHMDEVRQRLVRARKVAAERLVSLGFEPWIMPRGGFYLWCRLPGEQDSAVIARRCMEKGVILAPGNVFSVSDTASAFIRFNVAQLSEKRIFDVLADAMKQKTAA